MLRKKISRTTSLRRSHRFSPSRRRVHGAIRWAWAEKVRRWSSSSASSRTVLSSGVSIRLLQGNTSTWSTRRVPAFNTAVRLRESRSPRTAKADGRHGSAASDSFEAEDAAGLPKDADVRAAVQKVGTDLTNCWTRRLSMPLSGPRFFPAALRACSSTRSSVIESRAPAEGRIPTAQPSPRWSAPKVLPDFLSVRV